jgi:hypothetical protein
MQDRSGTAGKEAQELIDVKQVRDGVTVLANGTLRATLLVSSLNFALKSEDEQNAIIYAFQDFLNSLDFPVQICVMSRKLDITPYLSDLRERRDRQTNELLRLQMNEYINFVAELVKGSDIMSKTFLVTVSYNPQQSRSTGWGSKLTQGVKGIAGKRPAMNEADFEHNRRQLQQRVEQVSIGLQNMSLRVAPLRTQELLELYYATYNPRTSRTQRLRNVALMKTAETER